MADLHRDGQYAYLNRLSTEKLEELLRAAPLAPEDSQSSAYYDTMEAILLRRERENPTGRLSDLDSAWAEFQWEYAAPEGRGQRLYSEEKKPAASASRGIFRKARLAAAAAAAVLACMILAQAGGLDVFGALAHWTDRTFRFDMEDRVYAPQTENSPEKELSAAYWNIQSQVEQLNIPVPVTPTWYPKGYALDYVEAGETDEVQDVFAWFSGKDEDYYAILITKHKQDRKRGTAVAKDDGPVETYVAGEKLFYLMSNGDTNVAAWSSGDCDLMIYGTLSREDLKTMAASIEESS